MGCRVSAANYKYDDDGEPVESFDPGGMDRQESNGAEFNPKGSKSSCRSVSKEGRSRTVKVRTIEELAEGAGDGVMEDINDLEFGSRDSMAAKLAVRKASKTANKRNLRSVEFEEVDAGEEEEAEGDVGVWGTRGSMGASLAARKASKNKVNCARRVCAGAPELDQGETPPELQWGVRRSMDIGEKRSTSKSSSGSGNRRDRRRSVSKNSAESEGSGPKGERPSSSGSGGASSPEMKMTKVSSIMECEHEEAEAPALQPRVQPLGQPEDAEMLGVAVDAESEFLRQASLESGQKAMYYSEGEGEWFDCENVGKDADGSVRVKLGEIQHTIPKEKVQTHLKAKGAEDTRPLSPLS